MIVIDVIDPCRPYSYMIRKKQLALLFIITSYRTILESIDEEKKVIP